MIFLQSTDSGINDMTLLNIARSIVDQQAVMNLGHRLGFHQTDIQEYICMSTMYGQAASNGTYNMLWAWRNWTRVEDQVNVLRSALTACGLHAPALHLQRGTKLKDLSHVYDCSKLQMLVQVVRAICQCPSYLNLHTY